MPPHSARKEPALLIPGPRTSGLRSYGRIHLCCGSHIAVGFFTAAQDTHLDGSPCSPLFAMRAQLVKKN